MKAKNLWIKIVAFVLAAFMIGGTVYTAIAMIMTM